MTPTLLPVGLALLLATSGPSGPPRLKARIAPGPYYVGQAIEVSVEAEGDPEGWTVEPPRVADGELKTLPRNPDRPSTARFIVVPGRPGTLTIPAFRGRSEGRTGSTTPLRVAVANVPAEGRTASFLGGVGPFEVRGEAGPSPVRVGEVVEFRLEIAGAAAWGSVRPPDPGGWAKLTPNLRIETLTDTLSEGDWPIRTFLFRLRPSKAGIAILPPVAVSAFDPGSRRYFTRATSSLKIRVEEPLRFDPSRLTFPGGSGSAGRSARDRVGLLLGLALGSGAALAILGLWVVRRTRGRRRDDPARLARRLATAGHAGPLLDPAGWAIGTLTDYLRRVDGRPPGVLTPPEAREAIAGLTSDRTLADRAERLVRRCDRARFGDGEGGGEGLVDEVRGLFRDIAGAIGRRKEKEGVRKPEEAAGAGRFDR